MTKIELAQKLMEMGGIDSRLGDTVFESLLAQYGAAAVKEKEREIRLLREELIEVLSPFAFHAKALGLPGRDDTLTVISKKGSSALVIGAFSTALETLEKHRPLYQPTES